jgi:hypothetical protein
VVDGLHGEVECHELANGLESGHSSTGSDTSNTSLSDGCVNHTLGAELLEQSTGNLGTQHRLNAGSTSTAEMTGQVTNSRLRRMKLVIEMNSQGCTVCNGC